MSFAHKPRGVLYAHSSSSTGQHTKSRKPHARKRIPWDSSVNDLSVYKASPEELDRRKEVHRSLNLDVVQEEKLRKKLSRAQRKNGHRSKDRGQIALLREILNDSSQLQQSLEDSDRLIASVRRILGTDAKRIAGVPCVTRAPRQMINDRSLPDGPDEQSHLDVLSESIMDRSALNESDDTSSNTEDDERLPASGVANYQSLLDLARFKRLLEEAEKMQEGEVGKVAGAGRQKRIENGRPKGLTTAKQTSKMAAARKKDGETVSAASRFSADVTIQSSETTPSRYTSQRAINDTQRVERTQSVVGDPCQATDTPITAANTTTPTLEDLNRVLEEVQMNLGDYERHTGKVVKRSAATNFSGYTMALLDTVARMSIYFKECDMRLRMEAVVREKLTQDVIRLTGLVDALTTDIIATQEEYARLGNEFVKHRRETDQQMLSFAHALASRGIDVRILRSQQAAMQTLSTSHTTGPVVTNGPGASQQPAGSSAYPLIAKPAVLLTAPVQCDSPVVAGGRHVAAARSFDGVRAVLKFDASGQPNQMEALNHQEHELVQQRSQSELASSVHESSGPSIQHQQNMHQKQQQRMQQQQIRQQQEQQQMQQHQESNPQAYEQVHQWQQQQQLYLQQLQRQKIQQQQQQLGNGHAQQHQQQAENQQQTLAASQSQFVEQQRLDEGQQQQQQRHDEGRQQQQWFSQGHQLQGTGDRASELNYKGVPSGSNVQAALRQPGPPLSASGDGGSDAWPSANDTACPEGLGQISLKQQLAELNRQQMEAQLKLNELLQRQLVSNTSVSLQTNAAAVKQSANGVNRQVEFVRQAAAVRQTNGCQLGVEQQMQACTVSPSISPITCVSDGNGEQWLPQTEEIGLVPVERALSTRQIRISLPQLSGNGSDDGSVHSQHHLSLLSNNQQGRNGSAEMAAIGDIQNVRSSKVKRQDMAAFFALSSHVTS